MNILQYIPVGERRAVSRVSLAAKLRTDDRTVREQIRKARLQGFWIVSSSHSKGYYLAETLEDWERFKAETRRRANSLLETIGERYSPPDDHAIGKTYVRGHMRRLPTRELPNQITL